MRNCDFNPGEFVSSTSVVKNLLSTINNCKTSGSVITISFFLQSYQNNSLGEDQVPTGLIATSVITITLHIHVTFPAFILQKAATELLSKHHTVAKNDKTDHVVPWNVVKNLYIINDKKLTDEELLLVIAFLKRRKLADMVTNPQGEKVRFDFSGTGT